MDARPVTAWQWSRRHLLSSPLNVFLTLASLGLLAVLVPPALRWLVLEANFAGTTRADCTGAGACWVFVHARLEQFVYGFYPAPERWRVNLAGFVLAGGLAWIAWPRAPARRSVAIALLVAFPWLAVVLLRGGVAGLAPVETAQWGGLMLTLVIALVGMVAALPLGVGLALARRSELPAVRYLAVAFIEVWRGVPLITVLFMASVMLPLFLPEGVSFDKLLRALIGVTLFQSAYMAEVVRGGLQSIDRGQYEAAAALGLRWWQAMTLIILPQALRRVIPGIVNTFIALFKDTSLVLVIGLFDLLGAVQAAITDPNWLGYAAEAYVFAALVYWVFCFSMSRYSQRLEQRLESAP